MVHIALVMMLKNEEKRLQVTLDSVVGIVNSLIIYDTGSTDKTIDILKDFSKKHKLTLHLQEGTFVDFATSRNTLFEFADTLTNVDFLLLLDCNDEIRQGKSLRQFAEKNKDSDNSAWLVCQEWWSGVEQKYYNVRFLRNRCNWRYKGVVHEWIYKTDAKEDVFITEKIPNVVLYQDRTLDDDKSANRFHRDKELLLNEMKRDPNEARTVFYLAQTCACLNQDAEAYRYYEKRSNMIGFYEETFESYLKMAQIVGRYVELNKIPQNAVKDDDNEDLKLLKSFDTDLCVSLYMKAFSHSPRVECILPLVDEFLKQKKWVQAYLYSKMACSLEFPKVILFVDKMAYDYKRWHLLGISAFYVQQYEEGYQACLKAIAARNHQIDKDNLVHYEKALGMEKSKKKKRR